MNGQRFDAFAKALARGTTRRRVIGAISGGLPGLVGMRKRPVQAHAVIPARMSIVQPVEGFAEPYDEDGVAYTAFGNLTPALQSFYLGFGVGDGNPEDKEIVLLQILPGGTSEDLSPNAALEPADIPDGRLHVTIQDAEPDGEEFYYRVSHTLLDIPGARRYQIRDVGCVDVCRRQLPAHIFEGSAASPDPVIALVGFKMFFTGAREHELDRVGVWFENRTLIVAFRDQNGDDTFGYLVDFVVIPRGCLNVTTGTERGSARGGQRFAFPTPPDTDFVLRGWALNFQGEVDHEIREVGIDRRGDNIEVYYSDSNADDLFDWRIEWAHIEHMTAAINSRSDYTANPDPDLMNPERGMYFDCVPSNDGEDVDEAEIDNYCSPIDVGGRADFFCSPDDDNIDYTLIGRWLWLGPWCDEDLVWDGIDSDNTSDVLKCYAWHLERYRRQGYKVVFRPRYDKYRGGKVSDECDMNGVKVFHAPSMPRQKNHITEVAKMLGDYRDVIAFIQAGYLGNWGEWNWGGRDESGVDYTELNAPFLRNASQRMEITDHILKEYALQGLTQDVQFRTPLFAKEAIETGNGTANIGLHNDCFMRSPNAGELQDQHDAGTYLNFPDSRQNFPPTAQDPDEAQAQVVEYWRGWAVDWTEHSSFGGETCPVDANNDGESDGTERWNWCSNMIGANSEPASLHMSYLNGDYVEDAIDAWDLGDKDDTTCYEDIRRQLGYRFEVRIVEYTPKVAVGQPFLVRVGITNTGWARLPKPRVAKLVLRNGSTTFVYAFSPEKVEDWAPGESTIEVNDAAPPDAGIYSVRLWIPDPDATRPNEDFPEPENLDVDDLEDPDKKRRIAYAVKLASLRPYSPWILWPTLSDEIQPISLPLFDPATGENDLGVFVTVCG